MNNTIIAGIGSPFGADRAGWDVIDYIAEHYPAIGRLVKVDNPAMLMPHMSVDKQVVLIDAVRGKTGHARVLEFEAGDISAVRNRFSSHGIGVSDILQLATTLRQLPERLCILGLETGDSPETPVAPADIKSMAEMVIVKAGLLDKELF